MAALATRSTGNYRKSQRSSSGVLDDQFYDFSLDEIREQLEALGYHSVPVTKLAEFKRDLDNMAASAYATSASEEGSCSEDDYERGAGMRPWIRRGRRDEDEASDVTLCDETETDADSTAFDSDWRNGQGRRKGHNQSASREDYSHQSGGHVKRKTARKDPRHGGYYTDESCVSEDLGNQLSDDGEILPVRRTNYAAAAASQAIRGDFFPVPTLEDQDYNLVNRHARFHDDPVAGVLDYTRQSSTVSGPLSARSARSGTSSSGGSGRCNPRAPAYAKCDPVSRYHSYRQAWSVQRAPGERDHRHLRWAIKEAMMVQDVPVKRPITPVQPNDYIPPTDKQRHDLRWNIRQDMALQGYHARDY